MEHCHRWDNECKICIWFKDKAKLNGNPVEPDWGERSAAERIMRGLGWAITGEFGTSFRRPLRLFSCELALSAVLAGSWTQRSGRVLALAMLCYLPHHPPRHSGSDTTFGPWSWVGSLSWQILELQGWVWQPVLKITMRGWYCRMQHTESQNTASHLTKGLFTLDQFSYV